MNCFRGALAVAAGLLLSGLAMAQVVNGGFESGALAPWGCVGDLCDVNNSAPHTGTYEFEGFSNATDGDLSQALSTVAGSTYTVSAYVRTNSDPINAVRFSIGANPPVTCPTLTTSYALCTANFVALANNAPVHVYFKTIGGSGTVYIDDVSVTGAFGSAVPTLDQWALLALAALLMLAGWSFLRKRVPSP